MDQILYREWHVACRFEDLVEDKILTRVILDEEIILWRHSKKIMVWQNLCVHRGARLSLGKIKDGHVQCGYHGWLYNSNGVCVDIPACPGLKIPAKARVKSYQLIEKAGLIFVKLAEEECRFPNIPILDDDTFHHVVCGTYHMNAAGPRLIENFVDLSHLPFVHEGYLGDQNHAEINEYKVEKTDDGLIAKEIGVYQPDPYGTGEPDHIKYDCYIYRPLVAGFIKLDDGNKIFLMTLFVTPVSEKESIAYAVMSFNYKQDITDNEIKHWEDTITDQDIPIVESQRPELLPLDLEEEIHVRSDHLAVSYRRYLKDLGMSFGTN